MRTYTVREAAEAAGLSYEAMRTRVDRGQVQVVKRDGTRRIPESELERVRLIRAADDPEVRDLRQENAGLRLALQELRALPARVEAERDARERMELAYHEARAERQASDLAADELRAELETIAAAGPWRALRLRRQARAKLAEQRASVG